MNAARRKRLSALIDSLEDIKSELDEIAEEEQESLDNIPETFWNTERYEAAEEASDNLQSAVKISTLSPSMPLRWYRSLSASSATAMVSGSTVSLMPIKPAPAFGE